MQNSSVKGEQDTLNFDRQTDESNSCESSLSSGDQTIECKREYRNVEFSVASDEIYTLAENENIVYNCDNKCVLQADMAGNLGTGEPYANVQTRDMCNMDSERDLISDSSSHAQYSVSTQRSLEGEIFQDENVNKIDVECANISRQDMDISEHVHRMYHDLDSLYYRITCNDDINVNNVVNDVLIASDRPKVDTQSEIEHHLDGQMSGKSYPENKLKNLNVKTTNKVKSIYTDVDLKEPDKMYIMQKFLNSMTEIVDLDVDENQYLESKVSLVVVPSMLDKQCKARYANLKLTRIRSLNVEYMAEDSTVQAEVCGQNVNILIDTGSKINVMSSTFMELYYDEPMTELIPGDFQYALLANENPVQIIGKLKCYVKFEQSEYLVEFHILPVDTEVLILGLPFLIENQAILYLGLGNLKLEQPGNLSLSNSSQSDISMLNKKDNMECMKISQVYSINTTNTIIKPNELKHVEVNLPEMSANDGLTQEMLMNMDFSRMIQDVGLIPVKLPNLTEENCVKCASILVVNPLEENIVVKPKCHIASIRVSDKLCESSQRNTHGFNTQHAEGFDCQLDTLGKGQGDIASLDGRGSTQQYRDVQYDNIPSYVEQTNVDKNCGYVDGDRSDVITMTTSGNTWIRKASNYSEKKEYDVDAAGVGQRNRSPTNIQNVLHRSKSDSELSKNIKDKVVQRQKKTLPSNMPKVILFFGQKDANRYLSNFYFCSIKYGSKVYFSVEQAFQAEKSRVFKDYKTRMEIMKAKTSVECKHLGNKVKNFNGSVWAGRSLTIMRDLIAAKFEQNRDLLASLLMTKGYVLVENNPFDCIWGVGHIDVENPADYTSYTGLNILGLLLTEYRDSKLPEEYRISMEEKYWDWKLIQEKHGQWSQFANKRTKMQFEDKGRPYLEIPDWKANDKSTWMQGYDEVIQAAEQIVPTERPENLPFELEKSCLNEKQKIEVLKFLKEQQDVFAYSVFDLGTCNILKYAIKLKPGTQPIAMKAYTLGVYQKPVVLKQLATWYKCGMIKSGMTSEWGFPSFLVYAKNKPTTDSRMVVDLRGLNEVTEDMPYTMPNMSEIVQELGAIITPGEPIYVSALDCASGYLQLPVTETTSEILTMQTTFGKWSFTRVAFGQKNAPALFTEVMKRILGGVKNVLFYIDDSLCVTPGKSIKDHTKILEVVFERFRQANMKLKLKKVQLFQDKLLYLGHMLSAEGLSCNPLLVKAMSTYPRPTSVKELRRFLGLVNFYRNYCKDFARMATPLYYLLKKDVDYEWTENHQEAFESLIQAMVTAPVLAIPDLKSGQEFILTTDGSTTAVGYSLAQYQPVLNGKSDELVYRIIGYGGKTLSPTQRKWPISEIELYAVVSGMEHFKQYLLFKHFQLWSDHLAVLFILNTRKSLPDNNRLARWALALQTYKFTVYHKPGTSMQMRVADLLSRRAYSVQSGTQPSLHGDPVGAECYALQTQRKTADISKPPKIVIYPASDVVELEPVYTVNRAIKTPTDKTKEEKLGVGLRGDSDTSSIDSIVEPDHRDFTIPELKYDIESMRQWQRKDPELNIRIQYLENEILPTEPRKITMLMAHIDSFYMENKLLWKMDVLPGKAEYHLRATPQLCLPNVYVKHILYALHDSDHAGHLGVFKTLARVRSRYWFPYMEREVRAYVTSCAKCIQFTPNKFKPRLVARDFPTAKFTSISIDCAGIKKSDIGKHTKKTYENILVIIDRYSKYLVVVPLYNMETKYIAKALLNHWFLLFGCASKLSINLTHDDPTVLHSDNAKNFKSRLMSELAELLSINTSFSLPYNPQSNSASENSVKIVLSMLRKMVYDYPSTFRQMLPYVTCAYNSAKHTSTGVSPYELVFGKQYTMPFDILTEDFKATHDTMQPQIKETIAYMQYCDELVKQNVLKAQERYLRQGNKNIHPYAFSVGQLVLRKIHVLDTQVEIRKLKPKFAGPYEITKIIEPCTAILRELGGHVTPTPVHFRELKPYKERPEHLQVTEKRGLEQKVLLKKHKRHENYEKNKLKKKSGGQVSDLDLQRFQDLNRPYVDLAGGYVDTADVESQKSVNRDHRYDQNVDLDSYSSVQVSSVESQSEASYVGSPIPLRRSARLRQAPQRYTDV